MVASVDTDGVHRYPPHNPALPATAQYRAILGQIARIPLRVAASHQADTHIAFGAEDTAVAQRLSRGQQLNRVDRGLQPHGGPQAEIRAGDAGQGADTVQSYAAADPVGAAGIARIGQQVLRVFGARSDERRVGKACVSTVRSRWATNP